MSEVCQKIQSIIKWVNTGPSRGTAQRGRGGSPSSKYKEEKEGRQKEAKEKGELSFFQQYVVIYFLHWGVMTYSFAS